MISHVHFEDLSLEFIIDLAITNYRFEDNSKLLFIVNKMESITLEPDKRVLMKI